MTAERGVRHPVGTYHSVAANTIYTTSSVPQPSIKLLLEGGGGRFSWRLERHGRKADHSTPSSSADAQNV